MNWLPAFHASGTFVGIWKILHHQNVELCLTYMEPTQSCVYCRKRATITILENIQRSVQSKKNILI